MSQDPPFPPPDSYRTPAAPAEADIRIQRSRFLALVAPAPDEETARELIHEQGRRYHDARHVCYAWRLGPGPRTREHRSDAGEPSGTAGEPILAALRRADLSDCVGVVVRYFGGVKLGTGGLARAYGEAADLATAAAKVREIPLGRIFEVTLPYTQQKTVRHLVDARDGRLDHEEYGTGVSWRVWLPNSRSGGFAAAVTEATAGQGRTTECDEDPAPD